MKKTCVLDFKVGQLAEMRTFEEGFRGAWFRCRIKDILPKKNKILLEYYDFDLEDPSWVEIYQLPPYGIKSNLIKKQLMVRPEYPAIYFKSEMPDVNSISQDSIVIDGSWKVGDWVDWLKDDCYWSARIVKLLSDDKVQLELPMPPSGEGKEGEDGRHEAFSKDLRPFLDWSETQGWSLLTEDGQTSCDAHLIFPTNQGMNMEVDHAVSESEAVSLVNGSSITRMSSDGEKNSGQNVKTNGDLMESSGSKQNVKTNDDVMESSESSSSLHVKNTKPALDDDYDDEKIEKSELNVTREQTFEAALLDLEEIANKVNWMQKILRFPTTSDATSSSWKFV